MYFISPVVPLLFILGPYSVDCCLPIKKREMLKEFLDFATSAEVQTENLNVIFA